MDTLQDDIELIRLCRILYERDCREVKASLETLRSRFTYSTQALPALGVHDLLQARDMLNEILEGNAKR